MFFREPQSVSLHLFDQIFAGDFHLHRRADGKFFLMKVDHDDLAAGFEHFFHERELLGLIIDVVPGVAEEKAIDGSVQKQRGSSCAEIVAGIRSRLKKTEGTSYYLVVIII